MDKVVPGEKLVEEFGKDRFDVVISTEMLEHVKNWKLIINNLKEILKPNGYIYNNQIQRICLSCLSV